MMRLLLAVACLALPTMPLPAAGQPVRSLAGKLLVADPSMPDPRFRRTIVLMIAHGPRGAVGVIVNRVLGHRDLAAILLGYGLPHSGATGQVAVHYGGPVGFDRTTVLHSPEYRSARTVRFAGRAYAMTADPRLFQDIAAGKGPKRYTVLIGRAGWGPGQLEREISQRSWFTIPYDTELVFGRDQRNKWRMALKRRGVDL